MKNFLEGYDKYFIVATGSILVLMCGVIVDNVNTANTSKDLSQSPSPTTSSVASTLPQEPSYPVHKMSDKEKNPLEFLIDKEKVPHATQNAVNFTYRDGNIVSSEGSLLTGDYFGNTFIPADTTCSVNETGDMCYVGSIRVGQIREDIFAMKDVYRNNIFSTAEDSRQVDIHGSPYTVATTVNVDGAKKRFVVIALPQVTTGFIIDVGSLDVSQEKTLTDSLKIEHENKEDK